MQTGILLPLFLSPSTLRIEANRTYSASCEEMVSDIEHGQTWL